MDIRPRFSFPPRWLRSWRLAFVIVLLIGVLPYSVSAAPARMADVTLNPPRQSHTATLLPSGKVLIVGGESHEYNGFLASAVVYDPHANTWATAASMNTARGYHTATLLPSGKVLVAGGNLASAEVYDPSTDTWMTVAPLHVPRTFHTATLLPNGKVLVVGGMTMTPVQRYMIRTRTLGQSLPR